MAAPSQDHPCVSGSTDKRLSTAAARAAMLAGSLVESVNDAGKPVFILTRWAFTREFHNLDEVERVLDIMGASLP